MHDDPKAIAAKLTEEGGADAELIYEALRFYFWAAGQGISPATDQDCLEPEEGFWRYCNRTGDEAWETVAERFRSASLIEDRPHV